MGINPRTTLNWDGNNKLVLFKKETLADTVTLPKTTTGQTVGCITVIEGLLPAVSVTGVKVTQQLEMKVGGKVWHDRSDYKWTQVPSEMLGGDYVQQPHKSIRKGTKISI